MDRLQVAPRSSVRRHAGSAAPATQHRQRVKVGWRSKSLGTSTGSPLNLLDVRLSADLGRFGILGAGALDFAPGRSRPAPFSPKLVSTAAMMTRTTAAPAAHCTPRSKDAHRHLGDLLDRGDHLENSACSSAEPKFSNSEPDALDPSVDCS